MGTDPAQIPSPSPLILCMFCDTIYISWSLPHYKHHIPKEGTVSMSGTPIHAAADLLNMLSSETLWTVVVGMISIKVMDLWDKRLLLRAEEQKRRKRRRGARKGPRHSKAPKTGVKFE